MAAQWRTATCVALVAALSLVFLRQPVAAESLRHRGSLITGEWEMRGSLDAGVWEPDLANQQNKIEIPIPVLEDVTEKMSVTYEGAFAFIFILIIAGGPLGVSLLEPTKMTRTALIEALFTVLMLVGGIYLFTTTIIFQSSHFEGQRPLTIVEAVYVLSQMITTVGYGDITPALPRGQVVVGFYVLCCILLIADMVSQVSSIVVGRLERYSHTIADVATRKLPERFAKRLRHENSLAVQEGEEATEESQKAAAPMQFTKVPDIPVMPVLSSGLSVAVFVIMGVLFWHYYPGEGKSWLEAIYMSIITLSTVGFGAFTATTEAGKVFGAFWMLFGVTALVSLVGAFTELMLKVKEWERYNIKTAMKKMNDHIAELDLKDNNKMDKYQFIRFSLLQCGFATKDQLELVEEEFQRLKEISKDKDGLVSIDVMRSEDFPVVVESPAASPAAQ